MPKRDPFKDGNLLIPGSQRGPFKRVTNPAQVGKQDPAGCCPECLASKSQRRLLVEA